MKLAPHVLFWEYEYVKRHTRNLELLTDLARIRVTEDEVRFLVEELCIEHGLSKPRLRFANRTDRGRYNYLDGVIKLQPEPLVNVVCHELAHHWVFSRLDDVPYHGWDFTLRLDKLAASADELLDQLPES